MEQCEHHLTVERLREINSRPVDIETKLFIIMTAPGTMMHEMSHYLMCKVTRTHVVHVQLIQLSAIPGHVISREDSRNGITRLLIGVAPLVFGVPVSIGCILATKQVEPALLKIPISYAGFCVATMMPPSVTDYNAEIMNPRRGIDKTAIKLACRMCKLTEGNVRTIRLVLGATYTICLLTTLGMG